MSRFALLSGLMANYPQPCGGSELMTQLQDWTDQLGAELEKQSSARAAQVESLIFCGDYQAIREWLEQWEAEDAEPDSLRASYRQTVEKLR